MQTWMHFSRKNIEEMKYIHAIHYCRLMANILKIFVVIIWPKIGYLLPSLDDLVITIYSS
jgi:hypothetical protein